MKKVLETKDSQHARRELKRGWKTVISNEKKKKSAIGLGVDFEMETITPVFAKSFQNCMILDNNLVDALDTLNHEISGLSFLLVDHKNPWLNKLIHTETIKNMNNF